VVFGLQGVFYFWAALGYLFQKHLRTIRFALVGTSCSHEFGIPGRTVSPPDYKEGGDVAAGELSRTPVLMYHGIVAAAQQESTNTEFRRKNSARSLMR